MPITLTGLSARLLPPPGVARALSIQSIIFAIGNGVFTTGSAVFFLHVTRLTPIQVGIGFSLAGALALLLAVPMGGLADRFGGRRTWVAGVAAEALLMIAYPFLRGFPPFLAVLGLITLAGSIANAGRSVYTIDALPAEARVRSMAFIRSALNVGFFIGGGVAAIPLAIGTTSAYTAMALTNAVTMLVNAAMVMRMPEPARHVRADAGAASGAGARQVFRDRPYLVLAALVGVLGSHGTMFTETIPLWVASRTDAPKAILAALFAVNTVMAVLLQVPASRGADSIRGIAKLLRWGGLAGAVACVPLFASGRTTGWATIVLLIAGVVAITAAELWQSSGSWGVTAEIPPPDRRGAYVGALKMGASAQSMVGPAGLTWLAIHGGGIGWLGIAAIFASAGLASGPVMSWVARTPRISEAAAVNEPTTGEAAVEEPTGREAAVETAVA